MTQQYASPQCAQKSTASLIADSARLWFDEDGLAWLFAFKAALAAVLALAIAMRLDLPQPRTAMVTVFIVMRPQTGLVFARGFYRVAGTIVGVFVAITLIAAVGQYPEAFIILSALWIAICTAGAARNRNSRSYGFVLAGYTAAVVGVPALQDPNSAFLIASTRVAELSLGVICASVVSALVFPSYAGNQIQAALRAQASKFLSYLAKSFPSDSYVEDVVAMHEHLITSLVNFESLRVVAVLESHDMKRRSQRMQRLSAELMAASTRFHSLVHFRNQLRREGDETTINLLNHCVAGLGKLLSTPSTALSTYEAAKQVAHNLDRVRVRVNRRIANALVAKEGKTSPSLNLKTATAQLERFGVELSAYVRTYASLHEERHPREEWLEVLTPKTDLLVAMAAGARAGVAALSLGFFWMATAWPSGATALVQGTAICALSSTAVNPFRFATQIAWGTVVGGLVGAALVFLVYPQIDGFPLLSLAIATATIPGALVMTRAKISGYGIGYCVFMPALAGPENPQSFAPDTFINDAIAIVLSMFVAAIAQALILPATSIWFRRRITARLKKEVSHAYSAPLKGLRATFESGTRDLIAQQLMLPPHHGYPITSSLEWLNSSLEIGTAVIDFREASSKITSSAGSKNLPTARAGLSAVVGLFTQANAVLVAEASVALEKSMAVVRDASIQFSVPVDEQGRFNEMLMALNLIKYSLSDPNTAIGRVAIHAALHRSESRNIEG
ncbi:FUSC family protein [Paraburkholderia sp. CNPSo 3076]|uniref:FUSC family protein n=1 Tax=Paraburkholderia sp. CNPSo 3076 TaxID=2940936 RepID=UPI0022527D6C|nr:FUSC family protein [Paraburkholderia sp. CNPSo 3076]MCX5542143.1 FUSC family protein [Paraburkholderia sp. CNPSo 3076]